MSTDEGRNAVSVVVKRLFYDVMLTDCVLTPKPFSLFSEGSSYQTGR